MVVQNPLFLISGKNHLLFPVKVKANRIMHVITEKYKYTIKDYTINLPKRTPGAASRKTSSSRQDKGYKVREVEKQ